jgi:ribosomal protein S18 acetylase RimI-like enzyme
MIEVKKLPPDRWKEFRELRLEALQNDPLAFGSSYEEEKNLTEDEWKRRIKNTLLALANDTLVGMIVYIIDNKIKTKHIANIFGVYVKKEYRGQGVGKKLIESALKIIQKNSNVSKIKLTVNPEQKAAVKLYETFGFELVGRLKKELKINDKFYDELIMERLL